MANSTKNKHLRCHNHCGKLAVFCLALLSVAEFSRSSAFTSTHGVGVRISHGTYQGQTPALFANGNDNSDNEWTPNEFFENIKNFFWKQDNDASNNRGRSNSNIDSPTSEFFRPQDGNSYDEEDDEDDELPAGTSLLFKIPAKQMKPGGLRLFLMFYLMGMQNTPDPNTWRADQKLMSVNVTPKNFEGLEYIETTGDEEEEKKYVLEMLYDKDRTGMLQIELIPHTSRTKQPEIRIYRCGSLPSTSYLMQESVIVDGVLDELQNLSVGTTTTDGEPDIKEEDRLLIPDPETAIESARESLAFG